VAAFTDLTHYIPTTSLYREDLVSAQSNGPGGQELASRGWRLSGYGRRHDSGCIVVIPPMRWLLRSATENAR
jgi:hypothetical protein